MAPNDINDDAKEIELPVGETVLEVAVVVLGAPDWLFVVVVDINFINNGPEEVTAVDEPPTLIFFLIFFSLSPLKTKKEKKINCTISERAKRQRHCGHVGGLNNLYLEELL